MSYAPDYTPSNSFADDETNQAAGRSTVKTDEIDAQFAAISESINALIANLRAMQRDDDKLRDLLVEPYALAEQTRAMMAAVGRTPRGEWQQNTLYAVGDLVQRNAIAYICQTAHNSGPTFNVGFWIAISGDGTAAVSAEQAIAAAAAAALSQAAAVSAAAAAALSASGASGSAAAAAASALAAQNAANSIAGLAPVNLSAYMLSFLSANNAGAARTALAAVGSSALAGASGASSVGTQQSGTGAVLRTAQDKLRDVFDARDYGASPGASQTTNRAAMQAAIVAANAYTTASGNTAEVVVRDDYGYDSVLSATWPDFSAITAPVIVRDLSRGRVNGSNITGSQSRQWTETPQTVPPGMHDAHGEVLIGPWHPYFWTSVRNALSGTRAATDNLRASYFWAVMNHAAGRIGQGTLASATLTQEELSNFVIELFPLPGDTITGSNWAVALGERKTRRLSFGGGANQPLGHYDFYPGNPADATVPLILARHPGSTTAGVELQSSSGSSARSYLRNVSGNTEIGTTAGGSTIKQRQADGFLELGAGTSFSYHHSVQGTRASNWVSFVNNTSVSDGFVQRLQSASVSGASWDFLLCAANAGADTRMRVIGNGNVVNTNNSYGAISDAKLKTDIEKVGPGKLAKVMRYEVVHFRFKTDPEGVKQIGHVAQQIRDVSPGLVEEIAEYRDEPRVRKVTRTRESSVLGLDGEPTLVEYEEEEHFVERVRTGETTLTLKNSVINTELLAAFQEHVSAQWQENKALRDENEDLRRSIRDLLDRIETIEARTAQTPGEAA